MTKLFGTDGIRGIVNQDLNAFLAMKIGASVARVFKEQNKNKELTFLIGSDTRVSKDMLSSAVISGVLSEGANIIDLGVLPTPAISYLVSEYKADGAFVISASHNPSEYNGIKVLDENGFKLSEKLELIVENYILNNFEFNSKINNNGVLSYNKNALEDYVNHLRSTINEDISKLNILVDVANGAAYKTADKLFSSLNVNYVLMNCEPNGFNINNNAGSTHIDNLCKRVKEENFDLGIAYDGDADRCIMVDELGNVIDGDIIIAICGNGLKKESKLKNNTLVGTIMTNLGFIKFCEQNDINFVATKVGDKYVLDEMLKNDYVLGGEQSGHIIFKDYANTGDGELTSLQVMALMVKENKKLSELSKIMIKYPQIMINVSVSQEGKKNFQDNINIKKKIDEFSLKLSDNGRIVIRPSGTENLIRVMIEGSDIDIISKYCEELASFIDKELN